MISGPAAVKKLVVVLLLAQLWILGCSEPVTPSAVPASSLSAKDILERSAGRMVALNTAAFTLAHEGEFFTVLIPNPRVVFTLVEGQVDMPHRYSIKLEGTVAFSEALEGFIELEVVSSGDQTFMTDLINKRKWNPVEPGVLPFNFANLGHTLSDIIDSVRDPHVIDISEMDGITVSRIKGTVPSEGLSPLVPTADPGFEVGLELWIGQERDLLRMVQIEGQVLSRDDPGVVRLLTLYDFDLPVDISLP